MIWLWLGCASTGPDTAGPAADTSGWRDEQGRRVVHRGMNVSNASKSTDDHLPGLSDGELDLLVTHGITLARYLVFWEAIEPSEGSYDQAYLDAVQADVARLTGRGIEVVLDLHQDVYGEGFGYTGLPRWTCDEAAYEAFEPLGMGWYMDYITDEVTGCFDAFWESPELQGAYAAAAGTLAAQLEADPGVIGLEVMNEPFWGTQEAEDFELRVLPDFYVTVAAELPERFLVFVEPSVVANLTGETLIELPEGNWVLAPHFYPTYAELGTGWSGDFEEERAWLEGLLDAADERDLPFLLGEFGIFSAQGNEPDYVRSVLDTVTDGLGSTAYWAYDRNDSWAPLTSSGEAGFGLQGYDRPFLHRFPGTLLSLEHAPFAAEIEVGDSDGIIEVVVPGACTPGEAGDWDADRRVLSVDAPAGETLRVEVAACGA